MTMLTTEHAQTALEFLDASDREFEQGEILQGAEKLWGVSTAEKLIPYYEER